MSLNAELIRGMVGIMCPVVFETMLKESMCLVQEFCFYASFFSFVSNFC